MARKKVHTICVFCQEEFLVLPCELGRGRGKYCNRDCYYLSKQGQQVVPNGTEPWNKGQENVYTEEALGKMSQSQKERFRTTTHPLKGRRLSFESRKKMSMAKLGLSADSQWDGFITPENMRQRMRFKHTVQKIVFERDDYTCQLCDQRGGKLQVDHIQSWKDYVDLRFDIDNCRTLCMACHYQITYGRAMPEHITNWGHYTNQLGGPNF